MEKPIEEDAAIESSSDSSDDSPNPIPIPIPNPSTRSADAKPPEVEVHLYRCGKGPVEVFKCPLGGWGQDQLEVQDILDKHGLKSIYAFNPASGRAAPIRFNGRNGRSLLTYRDGAVICVDGQPKDSWINPVTKILVGTTLLTFLIIILLKDTPEWIKPAKLFGGNFPPWILACVVIVFTRLRKRTLNILKKYGW